MVRYIFFTRFRYRIHYVSVTVLPEFRYDEEDKHLKTIVTQVILFSDSVGTRDYYVVYINHLTMTAISILQQFYRDIHSGPLL